MADIYAPARPCLDLRSARFCGRSLCVALLCPWYIVTGVFRRCTCAPPPIQIAPFPRHMAQHECSQSILAAAGPLHDPCGESSQAGAIDAIDAIARPQRRPDVVAFVHLLRPLSPSPFLLPHSNDQNAFTLLRYASSGSAPAHPTPVSDTTFPDSRRPLPSHRIWSVSSPAASVHLTLRRPRPRPNHRTSCCCCT